MSSTDKFSAGDMATASAQGFRAGVAHATSAQPATRSSPVDAELVAALQSIESEAREPLKEEKERLLWLMGEYDFSMPVQAFNVIAESMMEATQQHAEAQAQTAHAQSANVPEAVADVLADVRKQADDAAHSFPVFAANQRIIADRIERALSAQVPESWKKLHSPLIEVLYLEGDDPFICAVLGRAGVSDLADIEKDMKDNPIPEFKEYGQGVYTLECEYENGQYDELGRCEFPPGWSVGFVSFSALQEPSK